jgi:hypothetical protein
MRRATEPLVLTVVARDNAQSRRRYTADIAERDRATLDRAERLEESGGGGI